MPQRFISAFGSYLSTSYILCLDDPAYDLSIVLEDAVNTISSITTKKGKPSVTLYDLKKDGEFVLRQQRRLCCIQHKEGWVLSLIHF